VREAVTISSAPVTLTFDLLTLKVVSESRVTWAISVPILVILGLSVLDLGPMYETDRRQTDVRQHHRLIINYLLPESIARFVSDSRVYCYVAWVIVSRGGCTCACGCMCGCECRYTGMWTTSAQVITWTATRPGTPDLAWAAVSSRATTRAEPRRSVRLWPSSSTCWSSPRHSCFRPHSVWPWRSRDDETTRRGEELRDPRRDRDAVTVPSLRFVPHRQFIIIFIILFTQEKTKHKNTNVKQTRAGQQGSIGSTHNCPRLGDKSLYLHTNSLHTYIYSSLFIRYERNENNREWKKRSEATQTLRAGCSKAETKNFRPATDPLPGGAGRPKFNQLQKFMSDDNSICRLFVKQTGTNL